MTLTRWAILAFFLVGGTIIYSRAFDKPEPLTGSALYQQCADAVVKVQPYQFVNFFGMRQLSYLGTGNGSGVLVNDKGDVLTAAHVVAVARLFRVTLKDGRGYDASTLVVRKEADIAILRPLHRQTTPYLTISDEPQIGDFVWAMGFPLSLDYLFSQGVISGYWGDFLLTDVLVYFGSSGGPLLDKTGRIVAVVSGMLIDPWREQPVGFSLFTPHKSCKDLVEAWN